MSLRPTREEQALAEVGVTAISPRLAKAMIAVFALMLFAVPVWQHLHELPKLAENNRKLPQVYDVFKLKPLPSVTELKAYETALEDEAAVRDWILPPTQYLLSKYLGAGNEEVYLGRDGWLFLRDGVDHVIGKDFLDPNVIEKKNRDRPGWNADPIPALVKMHQDLKAQGIQLIVVPIPIKAEVHPEAFNPAIGYQFDTVEAFEGKLADEEVAVHSSFAQFRSGFGETIDRFFLRTDTHWTPSALVNVARHLSGNVRAFVGQDGLGVNYTLAPPETVTNRGDLARMLEVPLGKDVFPPEAVEVVPVRSPAGKRWEPDPKAEILLLGDSFSNIYSGEDLKWGTHAGLAEHLSYQLQEPLDVIIQNGDGAFATRETLSKELHRDLKKHEAGQPVRSRLAGKKVVIYQFASRELSMGNWKVLDFPYVPVSKEDVAQEATVGKVVTGKIVAIEKVPTPGSVPYRDAVTTLHLKAGDEDFFVYILAMLDNVLLDPARWKVGDEVTVTLSPWSEAPKKYHRYQKLELDDPDFVYADMIAMFGDLKK